MAKRLNNARAVVGMALGVSLAAQAQALTDPMRPPSALPPQSVAAGTADSAGPQLQSILISPSRRVAVIDGQTVALGARFGEARLVSVSESSVVLKRGDALETLRLTPGVEKKPAARAASGKDNKGKTR